MNLGRLAVRAPIVVINDVRDVRTSARPRFMACVGESEDRPGRRQRRRVKWPYVIIRDHMRRGIDRSCVA